MARRVEKIRRKMKRAKIDALLITNKTNLRYLTNFTGSGAGIITQDSKFLLTDFRYFEQAGLQMDDWEVVRIEKSLVETAAKLLKRKQVGFESDSISFSKFQELKDKLKCRLIPVKGWVEGLRAVKSSSEKELLKAAAEITDDVFSYALGILKPGRKEREIAIELEYFIKKRKGADVSFEIIFLSGPRSSLPHGRPSSRTLKKGDIVLLDMGILWKGYRSDLTRTVCLGRMNREQRRIYKLVLEAQKEALRNIKSGIKASKLDSIARGMIEEAHFSLGHGLGHGVGLEVHEYPRIGLGSKDIIKEDMVVTIEPGIYIMGEFGIRIEDMVLVKRSGAELLTHSPRGIVELQENTRGTWCELKNGYDK